MAYDEHLAERITRSLAEKKVPFEAKKMMGGLCFMVRDKMFMGVQKETLMARIDPGDYEMALRKKGCREMDFTGRPMKGFVFLDPVAVDLDRDLEYWIQLCLAYNPKAKSSKKKRTS
ncbi:MAG TPA: TfoX/Sxy family protein [Chryseosolibacter sp.]|nr:TfoX/Sxy family protein [Chryseosolibacter sp.]